MTQKVRVSMGFTQATDGNLSPFAGGVIEGLTAQAAVFNQPPVPVATLSGQKTTYDTSLIAAVDGSTADTAAKNNARDALVESLRKNALYVEIVANNDRALLLTSGYTAASTNRAQAPLAKVEVFAVENVQSGELKVRVNAQPNAKIYEGRIKAAGSEFGPSISFANSRSILFKGLTAGVNYTLQLCAIGGSTGRSDWSDPVSRMAM